MKQAKGITSGSGVYSCIVVFNKLTGKILVARDRSCAAGKRGFCKHIAALCYKLVDGVKNVICQKASPIPQPHRNQATMGKPFIKSPTRS